MKEHNRLFLKELAKQFTCNCGECEDCKDEIKMVKTYKPEEQDYYCKLRKIDIALVR